MSALDYAAAVASNLTKQQVFALAESVAKQLNYAPGDDVRDLVQRMGGVVSVEDTLSSDPDSSGSLYVESPSKFTIVVPSHTSPRRDKFTIAHELGHFVVHYLWPRHAGKSVSSSKMIAYRRGSERVEWEANWFAGAFLMPAEQFREQYLACEGDLAKTASFFGVSEQAAEVRARQLNLRG